MAKSYCKSNHILIGLGGTGGKILKAFKMRMFEEFPDAAERDKQPVSILYVDSTKEMMGIGRPDFRVMGLDASFDEDEFVFIKDIDVERILDNIENYPSVKGIVNNVSAVKTAIGSLGQAAGQKRRAGRLLFAANATKYVGALNRAFSKCQQRSGEGDKVNIHIFTGLSGGTGSGSIVDAIVQTRKHFPYATISVYAMIPELKLPQPNMDQGRYYQNGYAALIELNALQAGRFYPHDITGAGKEAKLFSDKIKGVADGLTLYSNVNENGKSVNSLEELPKIVSDYIYARIFLINADDERNNGDILRAYSFENMDDFALEYDETKNADANGRIPVARTKKVNSFGIKRVMYPELRVLKHITYTIGEKVLYQFKYNHWRENLGYVDEEANKDYRQEYFNETNLAKWMLDDEHLTLEKKVLPSDKDFPKFADYWHDKVIDYADDAKQEENPLDDLDNILADFYDKQFRKVGVVEFYKGKEKAIPEIAKEIRRNIEHELFEKWKVGDISIVELLKISKLIGERISETRKELETKLLKEQDELEAINQDRQDNITEWARQGIIKKKFFGGDSDSFKKHKVILEEYYTCKTRIEAWEFAKNLATKLFVEFGKMDADISAFSQKINDAIYETERLIAAQKKVNKGLEDMKGAIIEVSEEETMVEFEADLELDKIGMPNIARQIREAILPQTEFTNFGNLANALTVDIVKDAFDLKLSEIVKVKHDEKADSDKKVLGLNILTQLHQKLTTDEEIKKFAKEIIDQSGVYLKLDTNEIGLHVRNNEMSPEQFDASINKKTILVSIPSPDENESLKIFADKIADALYKALGNSSSQTSIKINRTSPRKNELSVISIVYCFPIRAISWMRPYKEKYEQFLHTGNSTTDTANAILLHSEGDGKDLPSLFVVENAAQVAEQQGKPASAGSSLVAPSPVAGAAIPPSMPSQPVLQLFLAIGGQQYGPYDFATCQQLVKNGQLTTQTLVWQHGMAAWTPAIQVAELSSLFAHAMPQMPPMPPAGGITPPAL